MKQILLSVDGPVYLCLVPDKVEERLESYVKDFDQYVYKYKVVKIDEHHYRSLVQEVSGFIDWLNENLEEKSSIVKILNDDEIKKYDYLKWWNW